MKKKHREIHFKTANNVNLTVKRKNDLYKMEFPAYNLEKLSIT